MEPLYDHKGSMPYYFLLSSEGLAPAAFPLKINII